MDSADSPRPDEIDITSVKETHQPLIPKPTPEQKELLTRARSELAKMSPKEAAKIDKHADEQTKILYEQGEAQRKLEELAGIDPLTELKNRRGWKEDFKRAFNTVLREHKNIGKDNIDKVAVIFFDADDFKLFNDTYGHQAGDAQLKLIADSAKKACRGSDVILRYGGEEFAVITLEDTDQAVRTAQRIATIYRENQDGKDVRETLSFGVADSNSLSFTKFEDAVSYIEDTLFGDADKGTYTSKGEKRRRSAEGEPKISNISVYDSVKGTSHLATWPSI